MIRRQLRRGQVLRFFERQPACLVGIEACATSHHWAREISKLGHEVRLMPARYVKPYVKRNKNDAADAEAICEAVTRPTMHFVAIKTREQQAVLMLHRTRKLFVRQRTMLINALRAHLAVFGIVAGVGRNGVEKLLCLIETGDDERVPATARECLLALRDQLEAIKLKIFDFDRRILAWHRSSALSRRLEEIPGVGPQIASALVASIPDAHAFRSGARRVSLDRSGAEAELERRQGAIGPHLEGRQSVSAITAHDRGILSDQTRQAGGQHASTMACRSDGTATDEGRGDRARQQDRAHRLGHDGPRHTLLRACNAGRLRSTLIMDCRP